MKNLELLSKIALIEVKTSNFEQQMNNILKIIGEYTQVSRTYIFIDNADNSETSNEYEWCNTDIIPQKDDLQNIPYSMIPSWKKLLISDGRIFSQNIKTLPKDLIDILEPQGILSFIVYPIIIDNKIKGFIGFDECKVQREWEEEDLNLLATISGIISNLYSNHYYLIKIKEDKTSFENFFNTITDYVFIADKKGNILHANNAAIKKLEYSLNELKTLNIISLHPKDKQEAAKHLLQQMFDGNKNSCPFELCSKTGQIIPVETHLLFGKWNNQDCIFKISKDISAEQEALQKFTSIFNHNPSLMALTRLPDKILTNVNKAFITKLGFEYDEVIGKTTDELGIFPEREKYKQALTQLLETGEITNFELQVKCKNGNILYGLFSSVNITNQNKQYLLTVMIDVTEKRNIEKQIKELSIRDALTNTYNRRYVFEKIDDAIKEYKTSNSIFSISILDIDFFKSINDNYGHVAGDFILREFTKTLSENISSNDLLGRYGGEEFIILSYDKTRNDTVHLITKLLNIIREKTFVYENQEIKFTFSAGISDVLFFNKNDITIENIINLSDKRLYKAKDSGRNCIIYLD